MTATKIWYRTSSYGNSITPVEVIKETEKMLVIKIDRTFTGKKERRVQKQFGFDKYFKTWEEAHEHLLAKAVRAVNSYEVQLSRARRELAELKAMKPI